VTRHRSTIFLLLIVSVLVHGPARAQQGSGNKPDGHSLTLTAATFASYTSNELADLARSGATLPGLDAVTGVRHGEQQNAGIYTGLNGGLNYGYTKQKAKSSINFGARTNASYYPDLNIRAVQHMADIDLTRALGGRTTVQFAQSARASDHYRLGLFPDMASNDPNAVLALGDEYAVISIRTYSYITSTGLTRMLTKRASIGVNYGLRYVESPETDFDFTSHQAGASFQYQLTRYGGFRASYGYRRVPRYAQRTDNQHPYESHNVNVGIDYNRAFSLTGRRTRLTFTTGSAFVASGREEQRGEDTISSTALRPFLQGSVTLSRNLGRSWDAHASYRRMVHFVEGFAHALFLDSVSAGVGGQLGKHVTVNAVVGHLFEAAGMRGSTGRSYGSKMASAQFAHPIMNAVDVFAQYFYFRQELGQDMILTEGFPREVNRHSLRVGISLRVPLIP
jgi:hypothetical protein